MNIAFATAIIFILLIPGVLFRRFYFTREFSKQFFKSTAFELFVSTTIPAIVIHMFWMWCASRFTTHSVDLTKVFTILSGQGEKNDIQLCFEKVQSDYNLIATYNISLWIFSMVLGLLFKRLIRILKLDRKLHIFRFNNEWHYLLSGEMLDFPKIPGAHKDLDFVFIQALVSLETGDVIYKGILRHYVLSREGGLESIYLSNISKGYLDKDVTKEIFSHNISGQFLLIPYSTIINLNIIYYDDTE